MKLHVAGVIIHGIPSDRVHLFSVAPNLAGNANLNIECLYMAFKLEFEERGMLPELHVQVNRAGISLLKIHIYCIAQTHWLKTTLKICITFLASLFCNVG